MVSIRRKNIAYSTTGEITRWRFPRANGALTPNPLPASPIFCENGGGVPKGRWGWRNIG